MSSFEANTLFSVDCVQSGGAESFKLSSSSSSSIQEESEQSLQASKTLSLSIISCLGNCFSASQKDEIRELDLQKRTTLKCLSDENWNKLLVNLESCQKQLLISCIKSKKLVELVADKNFFALIVDSIDTRKFSHLVCCLAKDRRTDLFPQIIAEIKRTNRNELVPFFVRSITFSQFKKVAALCTKPQLETLLMNVNKSEKLAVVVEHLFQKQIPFSLPSLSLSTVNELVTTAPLEVLPTLVDAIPLEMWSQIEVPSYVGDDTELMTLIHCLKNQVATEYSFAQMSLAQHRIVAVFGNKNCFKKMVQSLEPYQLIDVMQFMETNRRKKIVGLVAREQMCMLIPLFSKSILKSCAKSLAKRMTIIQLEALRTEQFALLVPQLDQEQIKEMTASVRDLKGAKEVKNKLRLISPSALGIAASDESIKEFVWSYASDFTDEQWKRTIPFISLNELTAIYPNLSRQGQKAVKRYLCYNRDIAKMHPQSIVSNASIMEEQWHSRRVNLHHKKVVSKRIRKLVAACSPFYTFSKRAVKEVRRCETLEDYFQWSAHFQKKRLEDEGSLSNESGDRTFSESSGSYAADGDTTSSGERSNNG